MSSTEDKFKPPPRPEGLQRSVVSLYVALAATMVFFVIVGERMKQSVPDGKYQKKDGTLISLDDFNPVELGPYPKCHLHFGEYEQIDEQGARKWVKIKNAPSAGPFPAGHPENPEFLAKRDAEAKHDAKKDMFTWKGLQPCLHLLSLATLSVVLGSKHGVWLFTEPVGSQETVSEAPALLKKEDAYWFPVMGSILLFSLFVVYKYIGSDWIKLFVSCYILFMLWTASLLRVTLFPLIASSLLLPMCMLAFGTNVGSIIDVTKGKVPEPLFVVPHLNHGVTVYELVGGIMGVLLSWGYIASKNWIINNIFGLSFCLMGLKKIATSSFKTGGIMMLGLFFYDIFWVFGSKAVFGSNVMVTVAKGVEAPIKLMFPRNVNGCGQLEFSMLGLGDIVVPGIYISFLAKWDAAIQGSKQATSFVYLNACTVAYALSLANTLCVMLMFNAAQPALLYIVPYVMVASIGMAFRRHEFAQLWAYEIPDKEDALAEEAKDK